MRVRRAILKFPIATLLFVAIMLSCNEKSSENLQSSGILGTLTGKISIGPICPVETDPPSPGCLPTEATYKAHEVAVWTKDKKTKIGTLSPQLDGTYQIDLPVGDYILQLESSNTGIGGSNLPALVTIKPGVSVFLNINIDTGIR